MTALTDLTIHAARDLLARGKVSARDMTEAHLAVMDTGHDLNAFITKTPDQAMDARRARSETGPLDGIPLAVKDLFCTKDVKTTAGSHILDDFVPTYESTVTRRLWAAGAVIIPTPADIGVTAQAVLKQMR